MNAVTRYTTADGPRWPSIIRDAGIAVGILILLMTIWPFYSVPTGSRGVVSLTVRYSISPDKVAEVFEKYSHTGNLSSYVQTATHEIFKAVTAKYTAPDLIAQRAKVSADIYSALAEKLAIYGAQVSPSNKRKQRNGTGSCQAPSTRVRRFRS
jgi:hypothetical protein